MHLKEVHHLRGYQREHYPYIRGAEKRTIAVKHREAPVSLNSAIDCSATAC